MLDVVVQRPVDVADLAERERHQREPVVVIVGELAGGNGSASIEQLPAQQRRGAGDGVGDQQRQQIGVVVAPALQ